MGFIIYCAFYSRGLVSARVFKVSRIWYKSAHFRYISLTMSGSPDFALGDLFVVRHNLSLLKLG